MRNVHTEQNQKGGSLSLLPVQQLPICSFLSSPTSGPSLRRCPLPGMPFPPSSTVQTLCSPSRTQSYTSLGRPWDPHLGSGSLLLDSPPGLCPCLPFGMCHSPCSGVSPYPLPASSLHFILAMSMGMGNNLLGSSSAPPPAPAMSH